MRNHLVLSFLTITCLALGCAKSASTGGLGAGGAGGSDNFGGSGGSESDAGLDAPDGAIPCLHPSDCAALSDVCNVGACLNNFCIQQPANEGASCDDGLYCTVNDVCTGGVCKGSERMCSVGADGGANPCSVGMCNEEMKNCIPMPGNDGAVCTPTDPCFTAGECAGGACLGTTPLDCSFLNSDCSTGVCDMGSCKSMPMSDGSTCNNNSFDPCSPGQCMAGVCTTVPLPDSTPCMGFFDQCQTGECMAGTCTGVPAMDGTACDDSLFCTVNDVCKGGTCAGVPNPCGPTNGCYTNSCDEASATCTSTKNADGTSCMDGDVCNTGKKCMAGLCTGGTPTNDGMACTDTLSCNTGMTCMSGTCSGGTGPTIYFEDEFDDNSKGWTLDAEWQIGATTPSTCQFFGNSDPMFDQPMTPANGVAGVVLGGCEDTTTPHAQRYLTSPAFDTSGATGKVIFGFYRMLNSDFPPSMTSTVDVFDGTTWQNLWTDMDGAQDTAWTYVSYDVTMYKNAKMQVRFGFDTELGVSPVSGWNVDDVRVASAMCP